MTNNNNRVPVTTTAYSAALKLSNQNDHFVMLTDALYQEFSRSAKETPCLDSPARNTSRLQVTPLLGLKVSGSASTPMSDGWYWLLDVTFVGLSAGYLA